MSQREVLRGKRRAGAEASDDEQSEEDEHYRLRYPRSPFSHTKRKSMYNHVYGIVGRDSAKWAVQMSISLVYTFVKRMGIVERFKDPIARLMST